MTPVDTARAALIAAGRDGCALSPLAAGLSSTAWLVDDRGLLLVLRVAKDGAAADELAREHAVLAALAAAGAAVPAPISGSWERPDWAGAPFSLTTFVAGTVLDPQDVLEIVDEIADFLAVLQRVAVPPDVPDGSVRFGLGRLWPFERRDLSGHPIAADVTMLARLDALAGRAPDALAGPHVLVHSDLHEGNIIRTDGGAAFLDFGCAFVGSPLWDPAALAYFLGWPAAERVLAPLALEVDAARLVALSFALYRWETALDADEARHAAAFMRDTLDALAPG